MFKVNPQMRYPSIKTTTSRKERCKQKDVDVKKWENKCMWMSVSTSLTKLLQSLACNIAVPFKCKCTTLTIAALAANLVTTMMLFCMVLGTGIATLLFSSLAFVLTISLDLDLDLLLLESTVACPPLVDNSGAFTSADVALDWLTLRMSYCGEGNVPDALAGTAVHAGTGDGLPKAVCCGECALTMSTLTSPGTSQECSISSCSCTQSFESLTLFYHSDAYIWMHQHPWAHLCWVWWYRYSSPGVWPQWWIFMVECMIVLGKFDLVWFRPFFPKLETKLFGFSQNFWNQNQNRLKPFVLVWFGSNLVWDHFVWQLWPGQVCAVSWHQLTKWLQPLPLLPLHSSIKPLILEELPAKHRTKITQA